MKWPTKKTLPITPSFPWAGALESDRFKRSQCGLQSRLDPCQQRTNERTNERPLETVEDNLNQTLLSNVITVTFLVKRKIYFSSTNHTLN